MTTKPDDILISRWIDGDMHGDELERMEAYAAEHPELLELRVQSSSLGDMLREELPAEAELPHADFFMTQVMRRIERDSETAPPPESVSSPSFMNRLSSWLMPAAVAGMALCFYLGTQMTSAPVSSDSVVQAGLYTPDGNVKAEFVSGNGEDPTVIVLTGLDAIPDSVNLVQSGPVFQSNVAELPAVETLSF